ncbi:hypothetical protein SUGI_0755320 [Cryptomeria japonica]|uniref:uncharacterized protein LOC131079311 n=1 Tax=Cryptomeria japonica TaxID=3369 RepID=UPI002414C4F5|nr:uncharacterized protein LOC131079311 [Cryptomeria japonica]GLJ37239.1 hypothetical protein SUGI_0755320 [Cryptomeria japonica]
MLWALLILLNLVVSAFESGFSCDTFSFPMDLPIAGRKRTTEQDDNDVDLQGMKETSSCYCNIIAAESLPRQNTISYNFDFSDDFMNVYDESTPNDQNAFLNSLLTEPKSSNLFSFPENESVAVSEIISKTEWADDLKGCEEQSPYSGPILPEIESALSIYGGANRHSCTSNFSSPSFVDSFTIFDSLCTKAAPPELNLSSCSESYSLPISPSPQANAKTLPISKRQHFGNYVLEKNGPPATQNSGFNSYQSTFSPYSYRSLPSSINELLYRKLHPPKSEANYLLKIKCPENHKDDGYKWRKYGQKSIKNSPYPRSYYRCTSPKCRAKKQVERCVDEPNTLAITYEGLHLHYSYSPLQITQQPNYSLRQPENNIYERMNKRKAVIDSVWNDCFKNSIQSSESPAMVATHQQLLQEKDGLCESLKFGRESSDIIDGVVEEEGGGGRRDGLLQDIVPQRIINPLSSSSSSSSASQ